MTLTTASLESDYFYDAPDGAVSYGADGDITVRVEFDADRYDDDGIVDDDVTMPDPEPLVWANSARITTSEERDEIAFFVSVDDPRGAFAVRFYRVPADADSLHAGKIIMTVPQPGDSLLHAPLTEIHPGAYVVG